MSSSGPSLFTLFTSDEAAFSDWFRVQAAGARASLLYIERWRDPRGVWANRLRLKRGSYIAAVAIANKNARAMWALLTRGESYRTEPARRSSSTVTVKSDHPRRIPRRA
jgi:transposase